MGRPSLYEMKRACLSGKDMRRLLLGGNIWVGHTSFVYDGSETKEVEEGIKSLRQNLTNARTSGIKKSVS